MLQLKIPQKSLEENLLAMNAYAHGSQIWEMGISETPQQNLKQVLFHRRHSTLEKVCTSRFEHGLEHITVQYVKRFDDSQQARFYRNFDEMPVETALLFIVNDERLDAFYASKSETDAADPVILAVPGAHMQKVLLQPLSRGQQATRKTLVGHETGGNTEQTIERNWQGRCDRLAGAIGLGNVERGFELLDKARRMTVAVIGTGRAGSWIAFRLAQSGVGSEGGLILVDTDVTEQGNLDGMLVADRAVGFPKAVAVGGTIAAAISDTHPLCINASISDDKVLDVLKAADVVFTTVDEASVRLGAAVMASRFHLIHIDITGGLAWTMGKKAIAGGELRVFLPGSKGCLGCYDKYNWHEAVKLLGLSGEAERGRRMGLNWHEQRPGSSVDILLPVIGEALQSFWGILRGDVKQGFWYHYEKDHNGRPIWNDWSHKRNSFKCGICNKQGLGDVIN